MGISDEIKVAMTTIDETMILEIKVMIKSNHKLSHSDKFPILNVSDVGKFLEIIV